MAVTTVLRIGLLGRFSITAGNVVTSPGVSSRGREILAALLLAESPVNRQELAARLWPESEERQARTNLRRELHHLRQVLPAGEELVTTAADGSLQLNNQLLSSDLFDFLSALARAADFHGEQRQAPLKVSALSAAVASYSGDLMPDSFAEWLAPERQRLRELMCTALGKLAALLEQAGDDVAAIGAARRLEELEPFDENVTRMLLRLQLKVGERAAAIHTYHRSASALRRELGAEPEAATQELYRALLACDSGLDVTASAGTAQPAASLSGSAPLQGRQDALATLNSALPASATDAAHAVVVLGVAGLGKSRLVEEAARAFENRGVVVLRARAYAAEGRLAYAPVVEWLRSPVMRVTLSGLDAALRRDLAPLLPELRLAETDEFIGETKVHSGPPDRQHRMFEAIAAVLLASGRPVALVLDDLQWVDESTLSVLHFLSRYQGSAPLLLLTARPGELEDNSAAVDLLRRWREESGLTEIELPPLTREETARLTVRLAPELEEANSEAGQQRLFVLCEGNPLFLIEALRLGAPAPLAASRQESTAWLVNSSPSVRAVLQGRLSQLGDAAFGLAQCAAVIGRAFDYEVLVAACGLPEAEVVWGLDELWRRRIVRDSGELAYDFTHDTLREAAAATLSAARARLLHRGAAQALESVHGADLGRVSAAVARHYERAGLNARAIDAYDRAAQASSAVYAHAEAVRLLERALVLLALAPESRERGQRELELLLRLAPLLRATSGYTSDRLSSAMERAAEVALALGDLAGSFRALRHLWTVRVVAGDLPGALALARELTSLALKLPALRAESHHALGGTLTNMGVFTAAVEEFEAARVALNASIQRPRGELFGADLETFISAWQAHALWFAGFEEQAVAASSAAVATARDLEHRYSEAMAHSYAALLHYMRRDRAACAASALAALTVCDRYGFAYYRHWGALFVAWAGAESDAANAESAILVALTALEAEGAKVRLSIYLGALAEVRLLRGEPHQARVALQEALARADRNTEHMWDPELWRLTALAAATPAAARAAARLAVSRAQELSSVPLQLRAALTLGRLSVSSDPPARAKVAELIEKSALAFPAGCALPELGEVEEVLALLNRVDADGTAGANA